MIFLLLLLAVVAVNDWDNPYRRPIVGDAKGYYAYLPAIFIHHDLQFDFIHQVERDYYPEDGSHWKDFLMPQPNGTVVNKCFPGVAVFYLPFFLIAYFLSFLLGLPLDGYAPLFQWSVVVAHLFYLLGALILLDKIMKRRGVTFKNRFLALLALTFGTNLFFYSVYDFSVVHVFGFFGTSLFLYFLQQWSEQARWNLFGKIVLLMCLLVIMRPTNAMIVLALPLFVDLKQSWRFLRNNLTLKIIPYIYVLSAAVILFIPLLLWKLQTGHWLVYSYGEEKMDFLNPNVFKYLFSVQKGWWFWTPLMSLMFCMGTYYFWKKQKWQGVYFAGAILFIVYIFSSWWIWTYGGGMGQRPMIDFYPILLMAFAGFLQLTRKRVWIYAALSPLILLNLLQAHQINKYILIGGETTWLDYKKHFLVYKRPAPSTKVDAAWQLYDFHKLDQHFILDGANHFSGSIELMDISQNSAILVRAVVGGKHESNNVALVVADHSGSWYQSEYLGNYLYRKPRSFSYQFEIPETINLPVRIYIWNGDSDEKVVVEQLEVEVYNKSID